MISTHTYIHDNGSELYLLLCKDVLEAGSSVLARGMPTRELRSVTTVLCDPDEAHVLRTSRKPSLKIAATEAMHLIGGISSLEQLNLASGGRFTQFADRGRLRGAYGPRAHLQLLEAERLLRADPGTRQAGVSIWTGRETAIESKDVPCTTHLHFYIRDGLLELDVTMRSNDLLLGFPIDIMMFSCLQRAMAWALGISVGAYRHHAGSFHAYERDIPRLEEVIATGIVPLSGMPVPLPILSYAVAEEGNRGFSLMAARARDICLRESNAGFHDREWLAQRVPCLGPGWGICLLCRYMIKMAEGCRECRAEKKPSQLSSEELSKHAGEYVAVKGGRVVASAAHPRDVISGVRRSGVTAESIFRVPEKPHQE